MREPKLSTYGFLPRRARFDVRAAGPGEPAPVSERVGGQLRPVVAANERRRLPALGDEPVEGGDGLVGIDAAVTLDRQRFAGELVDDVQQLQDPAVGGLVELEVQRPHVIRPLSPQPPGRDRRIAHTLALAPPARHPDALLAPQPLRPLAVQLPALLEQQLMRAAVPPPRPPTGDPPQLGSQRRVILGDARLMTLGRAVLSDIPARPSLGDPQTVLQHDHRLAPARRAHQFPFEISSSAEICSVWSATIRFNRVFSTSSSFKRFTSSAFIPPYCARHR
jgi:hypothetical protein